jgi:hypothetical protein
MITYTPNTDQSDIKTTLRNAADAIEGRARTRVLYNSDIDKLLAAIDENPTADRIRRYSRDGFVANCYFGNAQITYAEANRRANGAFEIYVGRTGAKRSHGQGGLTIIR